MPQSGSPSFIQTQCVFTLKGNIKKKKKLLLLKPLISELFGDVITKKKLNEFNIKKVNLFIKDGLLSVLMLDVPL